MGINRHLFFTHLHDRLFPAGLSQSQVDGHTAILDMWDAEMPQADDRWLAYMLATAYHETARSMQPVRETLADSDETAAARLEAAWDAGRLPWVKTPYWRRDDQGKYWFGRGLVQLTHADNYARLGREIGADLGGDPSLAMEMEVALKIMAAGMVRGLFTGRRLCDYFRPQAADWVGARRIINGLESAERVAGHGIAYHAAITHAT